MIGGLAAVMVVAAVAAVAIAGAGAAGTPEPAAQPVAITGLRLPAFTEPAGDPAIGLPIPGLSGIGLDGEALEIGPEDGPMVIVVLAHWCPHCQAELPGIVDSIASGHVPAGVAVVGVSTGIDPVRPNFPPSAWLEREGWVQPTLIDDAGNSALQALGLGEFPGFVFVDAQGTVVQRLTGEIGTERFEQMVDAIAP